MKICCTFTPKFYDQEKKTTFPFDKFTDCLIWWLTLIKLLHGYISRDGGSQTDLAHLWALLTQILVYRFLGFTLGSVEASL